MEKALLTGANGFLGKNIHEINDYNVETLGRSTDSTIVVDLLADLPALGYYDLVIHAAGKAHIVPKTSEEKQMFYDINVHGTSKLLSSLEQYPPKAFIFISSIAVYGRSSGHLITEDEPLNANDAYGDSKVQAEKLVLDWCKEHKVIAAILRLPLLVGKNPPGNLGSMIKGIKKGIYFNIAGGKARKSMVLAEDIAGVLPKIATIGGIYNLTDGYHPSFYELSKAIAKKCNKKIPGSIPLFFVELCARIGDLLGDKMPINTYKLHKITNDLTFSDAKARNYLNWQPRNVLDNIEV
jgi:nucleoside-diphosphate-sugar epimerase